MARYTAIRGQNQDWLIVDAMSNPPRVVCSCTGWHRDNADMICKALNAYSSPIEKMMVEANVVSITDVIK